MAKFGRAFLLILAAFLLDCNCAVHKLSCQKLTIYKAIIRYKKNSEIARIKCASTHFLIGHNYITCYRGRWIGELPRCVSKAPKCNRIEDSNFPNGMIFTHTNYNRAVVSFSCHPHFILKGDETIYCLGSKWNTDLPICISSGKFTSATSCDFDTDMCGWTHNINHDYDWSRENSLETTGHIWTGPFLDHTNSSRKGHFMYSEAMAAHAGDVARMHSPLYGPGTFSCFEFYYSMIGVHIDKLNVYVLAENAKLAKIKPHFSISGNQGKKWHRGLLELTNVTSNFQIIIEAIRGDFSTNGGIAIDDVRLLETCPGTETSTEAVTEINTDYTTVAEDEFSCKGRCNETDDQIGVICQCYSQCYEENNCCLDYFNFCVENADDFVTSNPTSTTLISSSTSTPKPVTSTPTIKTSSISGKTKTSTTITSTSTQKTTRLVINQTSTSKKNQKTTEIPEDLYNPEDVYDFTDSNDIKLGEVTSDKTSNALPFTIIAVGILSVFVAIGATVFYSVRKDRGNRNWNQSTNDVRYLTSDEVLDFALATPDNNDSDLLIRRN